MQPDIARIHQAFGTPELDWIVTRLQQKLERGQPLNKTSIRLTRPTRAQQMAVNRLFGRTTPPRKALTVNLDELAEVVRTAKVAENLTQVVYALKGPIVNKRARRERLKTAWANIFDEAQQRVGHNPAIVGWLEDIFTSGLLRRLVRGVPESGRALLQVALTIAQRLPERDVPLAVLAAEVAGNSHALDRHKPLGTLASRLAAHMAGLKPPEDSDERRLAWESVGVICDELSAPALTLGLRAMPDTLVGRLSTQFADAGEPCRISTRQLQRESPRWILDEPVYICENPTIVAAIADRLGENSRPLVCTEGQPRTACRQLLDSLAKAGAQLRYHGDFDWPGITIANTVIDRFGASPWRMSTQDYLKACAQGGFPLRGARVAPSWDCELEGAMSHSQVGVHEEQVIEELLHDVDCRTPHCSKQYKLK